ncbi:hypothetical protein FACS1894176_05950 [Bacteroidia bacterium]|nr:hypothetical protein FACS1894176_05950 [Bacteroidia bacterium]
MSHLEQFIRDNRLAFDEQPPAGHRERLEQKINQQHRKTIALWWTAGIAASVAIVIFAGLFWQQPSITNTELLCENSANMQYCYLEKMDVVAGQIEELIKDYDPWDKQEVMDNVQEIIEATQGTDLADELPPELSAAEHKAIISDYYQHNLSSMEGIVYSLLN